ncbi:hypothetical protein VAR608DRAFT_2764 [Variovorax sp. HW608]|nr:hypothetical protein [Variovorax sp. HW608]SCK31946.1 hypothetical protein VAR608DRAFT_2764 [Variovorax sp. HW608]
MTSQATQIGRFELRFLSLFNSGRGFAFACDSAGHVNLDELSERGRCNYLFARAMVGREFAVPSVRMASPSVLS